MFSEKKLPSSSLVALFTKGIHDASQILLQLWSLTLSFRPTIWSALSSGCATDKSNWNFPQSVITIFVPLNLSSLLPSRLVTYGAAQVNILGDSLDPFCLSLSLTCIWILQMAHLCHKCHQNSIYNFHANRVLSFNENIVIAAGLSSPCNQSKERGLSCSLRPERSSFQSQDVTCHWGHMQILAFSEKPGQNHFYYKTLLFLSYNRMTLGKDSIGERWHTKSSFPPERISSP